MKPFRIAGSLTDQSTTDRLTSQPLRWTAPSADARAGWPSLRRRAGVSLDRGHRSVALAAPCRRRLQRRAATTAARRSSAPTSARQARPPRKLGFPVDRDEEHDPRRRRRRDRRRRRRRQRRLPLDHRVETRPNAVALVDTDDWQGAVTAASVLWPPSRSARRSCSPTAATCRPSRPTRSRGSQPTRRPTLAERRAGDPRRRRAGDAPTASARRRDPTGADPYALAAAIDTFFDRRARQAVGATWSSRPASRPEYAMPAAAWAARSGDPVLFDPARHGPGRDAQGARRARQARTSTCSGRAAAISDKVVDAAAASSAARTRIGAPTRSTTRSSSRATRTATSAGARPSRATTSPSRASRARSTPPPRQRSPARGIFAPLLLTDNAGTLPRDARALPARRPARLRGRPERRRSTTTSGSSATTTRSRSTSRPRSTPSPSSIPVQAPALA